MTRWFTLALLTVVVGCANRERHEAAPGASDAPRSGASVAVLYPPDRCILPSETLQVVAVADGAGDLPKLTLDSRPLEVRRLGLGWTAEGHSPQGQPVSRPSESPFGTPGTSPAGRLQAGSKVLVAAAALESGEHRIGASEQDVRVFVRLSGNAAAAPADWPVFHLHPPPASPGRPAACSACHEITETAGGLVLHRARTPDDCFSCHPPDDFELIHTHRVDVLTACHMCHNPHGTTRPLLLRDDPKLLCSACHE